MVGEALGVPHPQQVFSILMMILIVIVQSLMQQYLIPMKVTMNVS